MAQTARLGPPFRFLVFFEVSQWFLCCLQALLGLVCSGPLLAVGGVCRVRTGGNHTEVVNQDRELVVTRRSVEPWLATATRRPH